MVLESKGTFSACDPGWSYLETTNTCYKHDLTGRSWTDALEFCIQSLASNPSSTLASVHDNTTNVFLTNLTGGSHQAWLGGYQDDQENWLWADGSTWTGYNNWETGEPSNYLGIEDYLGTNHHGAGLWNDFRNASSMGSICQYKPTPGIKEDGNSTNDFTIRQKLGTW